MAIPTIASLAELEGVHATRPSDAPALEGFQDNLQPSWSGPRHRRLGAAHLRRDGCKRVGVQAGRSCSVGAGTGNWQGRKPGGVPETTCEQGCRFCGGQGGMLVSRFTLSAGPACIREGGWSPSIANFPVFTQLPVGCPSVGGIQARPGFHGSAGEMAGRLSFIWPWTMAFHAHCLSVARGNAGSCCAP
jgi:hypothetical protein